MATVMVTDWDGQGWDALGPVVARLDARGCAYSVTAGAAVPHPSRGLAGDRFDYVAVFPEL